MNWPRIILDGLAMSLLFNTVAGLGVFDRAAGVQHDVAEGDQPSNPQSVSRGIIHVPAGKSFTPTETGIGNTAAMRVTSKPGLVRRKI